MIPQEITNAGLYQMADNMLDPKNTFYVASHQNGYVKALITYLLSVDLGGDPEPGAAYRYAEAVKVYQASEAANSKALDDAFTKWTKQKSMGVIANDVYNMNPGTAADYLNRQKQGQPNPPATNIYHRAYYAIPNYGPTLDDWTRTYEKRKQDPKKGIISLSTGKTMSKNIGDPKATYEKLKPGTDPAIAELVRPTQLVCASGVGFKISFGGGLETQFDERIKKYEKEEGSVRIFGFNINVGHKKASTKTTHVGTWDRASSTFTINPTDQVGFCTLLGVIGEKITV
ncbi:hypothetical protein H2199_005295 [Coniosporium tulheliwenetii]|uniref:Uncharacterized protein n=1 Tax=Coniosporium tulheliwenetii TaxID=3383036 RepID=A0ACC2Z1U7_9PEZI|nr:hypothetical protein H2199_005295 [Cladosporium sp. JES 115]